nr:PREDICTED: alkaline phosphatase-like isoform X1 [Bemisia tabaci]XP_018911475.1 PREDICTED: alkaline phosphatase-like isoform X2 [Bemisia tabaci]
MYSVTFPRVVLALLRCSIGAVALPTPGSQIPGINAFSAFTPDALKIDIPDNFESLSETDPLKWLTSARIEVTKHLQQKILRQKARNIILFLGDGMSISTITAARILKGQKAGFLGEEQKLSFESFPFTGLSKTYCVDRQVADSASTATAYFTGVKTNYGMLGVGPAVSRGDCKGMNEAQNRLTSIATWAQASDRIAGLVTTTRVTHASPAGMYAHVADRGWESDADVIKDKLDPSECEDIASQLVTKLPGMDLRVILGGGRQEFLPKSMTDEEGKNGNRKDGRNLIDLWKSIRIANSQKGEYVSDKASLLAVSPTTQYLLGLFDSSHMPYAEELATTDKPSLADMTAAAIKVLDKNPKGYFLFVEGGRIDHGHHKTKAQKALIETIGFAEAIEVALKTTDPEETLIVVTADHGHTMTISGYPKRGNDILGVAEVSDVDQLTYTTLSYANGPSNKTLLGQDKCVRYNLTNLDVTGDRNFMYPGTVPLHSETHDGSDVAVYATGPRSFMFSGNYEQNYLPVAMAYAACIGPYEKGCI